jgi:hypothetical protein
MAVGSIVGAGGSVGMAVGSMGAGGSVGMAVGSATGTSGSVGSTTGSVDVSVWSSAAGGGVATSCALTMLTTGVNKDSKKKRVTTNDRRRDRREDIELPPETPEQSRAMTNRARVASVVALVSSLFARKDGKSPKFYRSFGGPIGSLRTACDATLTIAWFDVLHTLSGRRSEAQLRAGRWDGDPDPWLPHLFIFGPADTDIDG